MKTIDQIHRQNLLTICEEFGGVSTVAGIYGCNDSYIRQILNASTTETGGKKGLGKRATRKFEDKFNKPSGWMDTDHSISQLNTSEDDTGASSQIIQTTPGENRLPIRRALFKLSAGVSGYEIEYENGESEPIFMARRWFEKNHYRPEKLVALKVNGRSMEPKMYDGDLVIINTESSIPRDGRVFAVNYEGEMVIKRMKRDAGQWFITSDNPDKVRFGDKVCAESCFLLGEVVYLQTETI